MRYVRATDGKDAFYAVLDDGVVCRLSAPPYKGIVWDGRTYPLEAVQLLSPCEPSKVVCVGKNYLDHVKELNEKAIAPEEPLLFIKPNTAVIGPDADILYTPLSKRVDYEAELGVVIGKELHNMKPGEAQKYIFGYTCLNDVTARDIQRSEGQWTRAKGFDTFCPIGPWIETDLDAQNVDLCSRLNGEVRQKSNTRNMIHSIDKLLCVMSSCMTLLPGDVVATGTPAGIGPMQPGDRIEVEIAGIGTLSNTVR